MFYDMGSSSMDQIQSNDRPVWDMPPGDVARQPAARKWRNLDRSERTNGGKTPLKEPGAGTTSGKTGEHEHPTRNGAGRCPHPCRFGLFGAALRRRSSGAEIPVKSRKKRKSGNNNGPDRL